jgi:hypothetical protein
MARTEGDAPRGCQVVRKLEEFNHYLTQMILFPTFVIFLINIFEYYDQNDHL